jgi:hypothetical protein
MKTHHLHIRENTSFAEMGEFIYENQITEGDHVNLKIDLPEYDFTYRNFLFALFRESLSTSKRIRTAEGLPKIDYAAVMLHENTELTTRLSKDTGVSFSIV